MSEVFVTKELRRPLSWFFDGVKYVRKDESGNVDAWLFGKDLPDPYVLSERLKDKAKQAGGGRTEADPVTFKLWEHWRSQHA